MGDKLDASLEALWKPQPPGDAAHGALTLVVYAPFGADASLSQYPDGQSQSVFQHPLIGHLWRISQCGINVVALVDLYADDTYLITMPAQGERAATTTSRWKHDMGSYRTLRGVLEHAHSCYPGSRLILSIEGHGAGYWPDVDATKLTDAAASAGGKIEWSIGALGEATPKDATGGNDVVLPTKGGVLPTKGGVLPTKGGVLPGAPISTFGIGQALREARHRGVPRLTVVHFNNCFNFSIELLSSVADSAEFIVGYPSYNFFTSGEPLAKALGKPGIAQQSGHYLALALAAANRDVLGARGGHPTVGSVIASSRVNKIVSLLNELAAQLIKVLPGLIKPIEQAAEVSLQYDTSGDFLLEVPDDDFTDLREFALQLGKRREFSGTDIRPIAHELADALYDVKQYGVVERPWVAPAQIWDYTGPIGVSIFWPNVTRTSRWDWRSPYYLDNRATELQPNVLAFLADTAPNWVEFLKLYHAETALLGFKPVRKLVYPLFNPTADVPPVSQDGEPYVGKTDATQTGA